MQAKPDEIKVAMKTALDVGYRHIDTAPNYKNEKAIGVAIHEWIKDGGKREELFVTTKVSGWLQEKIDIGFYFI